MYCKYKVLECSTCALFNFWRYVGVTVCPVCRYAGEVQGIHIKFSFKLESQWAFHQQRCKIRPKRHNNLDIVKFGEFCSVSVLYHPGNHKLTCTDEKCRHLKTLEGPRPLVTLGRMPK